jgi:hypothetical protein
MATQPATQPDEVRPYVEIAVECTVRHQHTCPRNHIPRYHYRRFNCVTKTFANYCPLCDAEFEPRLCCDPMCKETQEIVEHILSKQIQLCNAERIRDASV